MRTSATSGWALAMVLAAGCSAQSSDGDGGDDESGDTGTSARELCDGSQDLRLAWATGGGGQIYTQLQRELGFSYLFVRGDCRYWVLPYQKPPQIAVFETRTGVLDAEAAAELEAMIGYDEFETLAGSWGDEGGDDGGLTYAHDGEQVVACSSGYCPDAPDPVQVIGAGGVDYFLELWEAGEPMTGEPMRLLVASAVDPSDEVPAWEIDIDLDAIEVEPEQLEQDGVSTVIDDPVLADALREFRADHPEPTAHFEPVLVDDGGVVYQVFVRDAVPLEDPQGLIPVPWD